MNIGFDPNRIAQPVKEWVDQHIVGSIDVRTVKKWIDDPDTDIIGYNIGSMYFVYIDTKADEKAQEVLSEIGIEAA